MTNTFTIFLDRKEELEFYYAIMLDLDTANPTIKTPNNSKFFKILKSNYILMLYNLVEACTVSGILEIYEQLKNDNCTYQDVIDEIKEVWLKLQVSKIYNPIPSQKIHEKQIKEIIDKITQNKIIELTKDAFKASGNLDAKQIKIICDNHGIRYVAKDEKSILEIVRNKRNSLSHGDISFSDCARDLTLEDLLEIKEQSIKFMDGILQGMRNYYSNRGYSKELTMNLSQ